MISVAHRARRPLRLRLAAICVSLVVAGCLDFSTSPDEILYLTFERLPFPSVVSGDTLRDSTGVATPLTATAVNGAGGALQSSALRYYAVDDTGDVLEVDSISGRVVSAVAQPRVVRIIAAIGGLQSAPLSLAITKRPDSLALSTPRDTITYSFVDTTRNYSDALAAAVLHNDSTTFYSGVSGWVVRYQLERPSDTTFVSIVDDLNRRLRSEPTGVMHIDTTTGDGGVSRKLRLQPGALLSPVDSVALLVEAKYRGVHVAGSPSRIVVILRPGT